MPRIILIIEDVEIAQRFVEAVCFAPRDGMPTLPQGVQIEAISEDLKWPE